MAPCASSLTPALSRREWGKMAPCASSLTPALSRREWGKDGTVRLFLHPGPLPEGVGERWHRAPLPSPRPSSGGSGGKMAPCASFLNPALSRRERGKDGTVRLFPHPGPLPEGVRERWHRAPLSSPRPSPGGRGGKMAPCASSLTPALFRRERGKRSWPAPVGVGKRIRPAARVAR